jgi:hypothetical protein
VRGLGVVCVTYCVGGLKVANATAQAYAEKSPVVVISGAPGMREREKNPLLHHKVREFNTQKCVFEQLTAASTVLDDPQTALQEIDRVLHTALRYKRPVYIELPRDMVSVPGIPHHKLGRHSRGQRSGHSARIRGRSRRHAQPRQATRHPGRRGESSLRLAKGTVALDRKIEHPRRGDHHGQVGHRGELPVLPRRLCRGDGPRGSAPLRRAKRLRADAGRVHDRSSIWAFSRRGSTRPVASPPPAKN